DRPARDFDVSLSQDPRRGAKLQQLVFEAAFGKSVEILRLRALESGGATRRSLVLQPGSCITVELRIDPLPPFLGGGQLCGQQRLARSILLRGPPCCSYPRARGRAQSGPMHSPQGGANREPDEQY